MLYQVWKWIKKNWAVIKMIFFWTAGLGICLWVAVNMFKTK